jgi:SAM-dependent methyltransferase
MCVAGEVRDCNNMTRENFSKQLARCFKDMIEVNNNLIVLNQSSLDANQQQTNEVFSEKWQRYEKSEEREKLYKYQRDWYLKLYGFKSEDDFADFLRGKSVIFDAGCGLGYKTEWFAKLAPNALVIGMDFSNAANQAARTYCDVPNLFFLKGDIAKTGLVDGCVGYTSCDQVIMHTENPEVTFSELARITEVNGGEFACYFYAKKALPRELLDDYFRTQCRNMNRTDLWELSKQLTELGKRLAELRIKFDCPDIPALGIKGGIIDIQRFIYWNFIKCFWNQDLGIETSVVTNFDWYSPSNARRFSEKEVGDIVMTNKMVQTFFHTEEACYSGRFAHE